MVYVLCLRRPYVSCISISSRCFFLFIIFHLLRSFSTPSNAFRVCARALAHTHHFLPIVDLFVFINVRYPLNRLMCAFSVCVCACIAVCELLCYIHVVGAAAAVAFFPPLSQLNRLDVLFHFISIKLNLISCKCTCTVVSQHFTFTFF